MQNAAGRDHAPQPKKADFDEQVFDRLSPAVGLRQRVFLFFVAILAGGLAAILLGGVVGAGRYNPATPGSAFIASMAIAGFLLFGIVAGVWLLFDQYISQPLIELAGALRASAHAGVALKIDARAARYLGDLAPAANAAALSLARARSGVDEEVGRQTARLLAESELLGEALRDVPVGLFVCDADDRIVLYNREAVRMVEGGETVGLSRPLSEAVPAQALREKIRECMGSERKGGAFEVALDDGRTLSARLRGLALEGANAGGAYALALFAKEPPARRIESLSDPADAYHDLSLLEAPTPSPQEDAPLNRLSYVVLDTETTGLHPETGDEIVQIAAARIVNGRLLSRETFDTLVDPERPIPPASTEFHGIVDEMVKGAPRIDDAGARLRRYASGSVLVAHNAPFDLAFFKKHEARIGARFDMPILDTVLLSSAVFGQTTSHSLDSLADRFEVEIPEQDRHTAKGDAMATAKILLRLIPVLEERGLRTLGDAQRACEQQQLLRAKQRAERSGS